MAENQEHRGIYISTGTLFRVVLIGLLIIALFKLRSLVLVMLTSIVIASFVQSALSRVKKFIPNRSLAAFLIYFLSISIFVGLFSIFIPVFLEEMSALVAQLGEYIPTNSFLNTFQSSSLTGAKDVATSIVGNASLGDVIQNTQNLADSFSGGFLTIFGAAFDGLFNLALIVIISFYLSVNEKGIESFLRIITPSTYEEYVIDLWQRTERKIGLWIQGQMLLGIIIGILAYLGLTILGVQYSLVLALLTACFELIPFGMVLSIIPVLMFSYLGGGIYLVAKVFILYFILHQFENYLIYPLIVKKVIGVSPLVVVISLLAGAELAGLWGIILAIPCSVFILEFMDDVEKKKIVARKTE
jgi:predicted PurR-regulated permease PerM